MILLIMIKPPLEENFSILPKLQIDQKAKEEKDFKSWKFD